MVGRAGGCLKFVLERSVDPTMIPCVKTHTNFIIIPIIIWVQRTLDRWSQQEKRSYKNKCTGVLCVGVWCGSVRWKFWLCASLGWRLKLMGVVREGGREGGKKMPL